MFEIAEDIHNSQHKCVNPMLRIMNILSNFKHLFKKNNILTF
jgi:hypothetical protein